MEIYKRQKPLNLHIPKSVLVVGCGGVGSWTAILLALLGTKKLVLVDPDILEEHNLNRLPFSSSDVGKPKVDVLQDFLMNIRKNIEVTPIQQTFYNALPLIRREKFDLMVDAVDNASASDQILEYASKKKIPYLEIKYDGFNFSVRYMRKAEYVQTWDVDGESGYRVVPSFVGSAVLPVVIGLIVISALNLDKYYIRADMKKLIKQIKMGE